MEKEYESLWKIFVFIFQLSQGQSAVERGFEGNKKFIVENQSERSLKSFRIIHDHLLSKKASNITISREIKTLTFPSQ